MWYVIDAENVGVRVQVGELECMKILCPQMQLRTRGLRERYRSRSLQL